MKLIYRITLYLAATMIPIMALWGTIFYFAMVNEINDEADDMLSDYAELIITRCREGRPLPSLNSGSNNSYTITPADEDEVANYRGEEFADREVYIPELDDTEPARVLTKLFTDSEGRYLRLEVATPTFEKEDLLRTILSSIAALIALLMVVVVLLAAFVVRHSLQPLYALLKWLDGYTPGSGAGRVPISNDVVEFKRLTEAAQRAVNRSEMLLDRQKQFIGNASHELQTPLAVIGNRVEYLMDHTPLSEEQLAELSKIQHSLRHSVRLNRTLLMLMRIESGQVGESERLDLGELVDEVVGDLAEVYAHRGLSVERLGERHIFIYINEAMARMIVTNLIKNAFVHAPEGSVITVRLSNDAFTVSNDASESLDRGCVFDRFYTHTSREGSTGLGLAIVRSVAEHYGFVAEYDYRDAQHHFSVRLRR